MAAIELFVSERSGSSQEMEANGPHLHVISRSVKGLRNQDWCTKQYVYCCLQLGDHVDMKEAQEAKVIVEGELGNLASPAWRGDTGTVDLEWKGEKELKVELWDKEDCKEDVYIGELMLNLDALAPSGEFKGDLRVFRKGISVHASLSLEISCHNFGKRPEATVLPVLAMVPFKVHRNGMVGALTSHESGESRQDFKCYQFGLQGTAEVFGGEWNAGADGTHPIVFAEYRGIGIRTAISALHNMMYLDEYNYRPGQGPLGMRTTRHWLSTGEEFLQELSYGMSAGCRQVFTYSLLDEGFFFSETGATLAKDNASKHFIHANAAMKVRFAGTFRICLNTLGKHVLVFDNDSGSYRPKKDHMPLLKRLLETNFPGVPVYVLNVVDPQPAETLDFIGPNETMGDPDAVYAGTWKWRDGTWMWSKWVKEEVVDAEKQEWALYTAGALPAAADGRKPNDATGSQVTPETIPLAAATCEVTPSLAAKVAGDALAVCPPVGKEDMREPCEHGIKCYNKTKEHRARFWHPPQPDADEGQYAPATATSDRSPDV